MTRSTCCCWRRPIRSVIPACSGGLPPCSASRWTQQGPRRRRTCSRSIHAWDSATRFCVPRSTGPHRRKERRTAHRALAAATDPESDPDRRAWHRAQAVLGPDEDVAAELERSAGRARTRGGFAAAAAFLQRSVALTQGRAQRADRALVAAETSLQAGEFDAALRLVAAAEAGPLDELGRARVGRLRAEVAFAQDRGGEAPLLLLEAARKLEVLDVRLARDTYLDAWAAALFAGRMAREGGSLVDVSHAVAGCSRRAGPATTARSARGRPGAGLHRRTPRCSARAPARGR